MTYTFKAQAKSNAKRFLVQTCKLEAFNLYLTEHDGSWGCWLDSDGKPVLASDAAAARHAAEAASVEVYGTQGSEAPVEMHGSAPSLEVQGGSAFGAFAASQLGREDNSVTAAAALVAATARAPEDEDAPAASSSSVIEKNREERNGVKRPSAGTVCARVWLFAELLTQHMGTGMTLALLVSTATENGINEATARTQYARWRKFNGITGRGAK